MKRSKPLKRSWMRRGKRRSKYSKRYRCMPYMEWCKRQYCCNCGASPPNEAHHSGDRAFGRKAPDQSCVPHCKPCHDSVALLKNWQSKSDRTEWYRFQVEIHNRRFVIEHAPARACHHIGLAIWAAGGNQ